jgi:hypothetical protein
MRAHAHAVRDGTRDLRRNDLSHLLSGKGRTRTRRVRCFRDHSDRQDHRSHVEAWASGDRERVHTFRKLARAREPPASRQGRCPSVSKQVPRLQQPTQRGSRFRSVGDLLDQRDVAEATSYPALGLPGRLVQDAAWMPQERPPAVIGSEEETGLGWIAGTHLGTGHRPLDFSRRMKPPAVVATRFAETRSLREAQDWLQCARCRSRGEQTRLLPIIERPSRGLELDANGFPTLSECVIWGRSALICSSRWIS